MSTAPGWFRVGSLLALVLSFGLAACALGTGGWGWLRWQTRRQQHRRSEDLRRRFEECYDQMVLTLGRQEAERDLTRSLERFDREMARLVR
ncbi:MAG: hypothetical protein ACKV2O_20920 [Acidimicrobiales bacterium]